MRGRKPKPTALKLAEGNPGKRKINGAEPKPPRSLPDCPGHLAPEAKAEWDRLAVMLNQIGLLTQVDRATMAAYCQCYARWVEAEEKLKETPVLLRMPSGYIQQSPWLIIGPVPVLFRSGAHIKRPCVRRPQGFSSPRLSVGGADYRSR